MFYLTIKIWPLQNFTCNLTMVVSSSFNHWMFRNEHLVGCFSDVLNETYLFMETFYTKEKKANKRVFIQGH